MLDEFDRLLNHINDMDSEWGPLLFLRPERHERMSSRRVAQLAALYGVLSGVIVNVVAHLTEERASHLHPLLFPCAITLGFFALYRSTFAACWNRRAERIGRGGRE